TPASNATRRPRTALLALSLHAALPISDGRRGHLLRGRPDPGQRGDRLAAIGRRRAARRARPTLRRQRLVAEGDEATLETSYHLKDRKSTRLNSSHVKISYAVFCLKKKK